MSKRLYYFGPKFVVADPGECWPWLGPIDLSGYGRLTVTTGKRAVVVLAHRHVYRLLVGSIPRTHELDHLCRNRSCVNPSHLEIVEHRENSLRRPDVIAARTREVCIHGHTLTHSNIYVRPNGRIECRICKRKSVTDYRTRRGI